jgi:ABC-type dipeptide/oligopeptide/nickel transport system permease subunit
MEVCQRPRAPEAGHLLGADEYGHDVFARVLHRARLSSGLAFSVMAMVTVLELLSASTPSPAAGSTRWS